MSSASLVGRCRITVPAAEKITTTISRITPVLMELSVCQSLRPAEPRVVAMSLASGKREMHVPSQSAENHEVLAHKRLSGPGRYPGWRLFGPYDPALERAKGDFTPLDAVVKSPAEVTQVLLQAKRAEVQGSKTELMAVISKLGHAFRVQNPPRPLGSFHRDHCGSWPNLDLKFGR